MNDQRERPQWLPADEPELLLASRRPRVDHRLHAELCRSLIRPTKAVSGGGAAPQDSRALRQV